MIKMISTRRIIFFYSFELLRRIKSSLNIIFLQQLSMRVEDEQPSTQSIHSLIHNHSNRQAIVASLLDALTALGYHKTLKSLQIESHIALTQKRVIAIEGFLKDYCYEQARQEIQKLELTHQARIEIMDNLEQLLLIRMISLGEIDSVLTLLASSSLTEQRKQTLYPLIALESPIISEEEIEERHKKIVEKCQKKRQESSVKDLLTSYLLSDSTPPNHTTQAPKTVVAETEGTLKLVGRTQFIKFNNKGNRLVVVSEGSVQYEVSLWQIEGQKIRKIRSFKERLGGVITAVQWSPQQVHSGQLIGVCSYVDLMILTSELLPAFRINRTTFSLPKLLCFDWNPQTGVLYLGGLFPKLLGFDPKGELMTEVCPFTNTRSLVFSPKGDLFAITATGEGQLVRFNIQTEKIERQYMQDALFMDLKWQDGKILTTNKLSIFVMDAETLNPIFTIQSPPNDKLLVIQAFLCGDWLISFNQKLRGTLKRGNSARQVKWDNCDAVDVHGRTMVTIKSSIRLWAAAEECADQVLYQEVDGSSSDEEVDSSSSSSVESDSSQAVEEYLELMEVEVDNYNNQPDDQ